MSQTKLVIDIARRFPKEAQEVADNLGEIKNHNFINGVIKGVAFGVAAHIVGTFLGVATLKKGESSYGKRI